MADEPRRGIALMVLSTLIFAAQDGLSRQLAAQYNVLSVVMIRYWFFAAFAIAWVASRGELRRALCSPQRGLQIGRGVLLVIEVCVCVAAFTLIGLVETHAVFAVAPLLVVALSGPLLGEAVGWRRWGAVAIGFVGVLVILRPGAQVISAGALVALLAAVLFAAYVLLTRRAAQRDPSSVSFFWTGVAGAAAISLIGPFYWRPPQGEDWWLMGALCLSGALGHYTMIRAYEAAPAASLQPVAYGHLVFAVAIGVSVFGERPAAAVLLGCALVVAAGLYSWWRERQRAGARMGDCGRARPGRG